jgi:hypothetical protein
MASISLHLMPEYNQADSNLANFAFLFGVTLLSVITNQLVGLGSTTK